MNLSIIEHLLLIESHLKKLLAIAENRTHGKWEIIGQHQTEVLALDGTQEAIVVVDTRFFKEQTNPNEKEDATFIAACAGNAEAGWKSTLAVIDHVLEIMEVLGQNPEHPLHVREQEVAEAIALKIIAAYPIELLE